MATAPLVEPSAPKLRTHLRAVGAQLTELLELLVNIRSRAEVHRPYKVIKTILREVRAPVALEQRDGGGLPRLPDDIPDSTNICLILAIATIFVLHLHHDDGTALVDGQVSELLAHLLFEDLEAFHEVRILLAQTDILLLQQPPRQTAHLPLCTDVGTRAHDDPHVVLLCQLHERADVIVTREVEDTLLLLVRVPEDIDTQRVHAQRFAHLDALLPVFARDTWIMHFGSFDNERFVV